MANRSPPYPHRYGSTTPRVRLAATAASTALPPEARTSRPTEEARWCGEATQPEGNRRASTPPDTVSRVREAGAVPPDLRWCPAAGEGSGRAAAAPSLRPDRRSRLRARTVGTRPEA